MGAGATGGGLSIMGGILGGIGDIYKAAKYKRPKFPKATGQEKRLRQFTMQDLMNARESVYGGAGLYNQALPFMLGAIPGYSASVESDPQSSAAFDEIYNATQARGNLQSQKQAAKATLKGIKPGGGRRKGARANLKSIKQQLKGTPTLDALRRGLNRMQATPANLKITKNAPTETDTNAQSIQDMLSNRTLSALRGELPNPTLEHELTRQQAEMENHMMNQLGPDWENSTGGIQARQQFNQYANDQRDMSNRRDISQLYPEQLSGQQAQYGFAGNQQSLLGQPTLQQLSFAKGMSGLGGDATAAQSPYQFDRQGGWAEQQNPSQIWGDMMAQSGNRWASIGGGMSGGGGQPQQSGGGGGNQASSGGGY